MALRQGVDSRPIRMYEATPQTVASNIIFLVAWLAGTTGCFLSILVTTFTQCVQWLPFLPENSPTPLANVTERTPRCPPRLKPTITQPSLSRENVERHISFSLESRTSCDVQQALPPGENMTCTTASFSSGDSTLCSSPLSDLGDLPPLKNLPPLLLDPQMPEQIQVRKRPMTASFSVKARNPFKFHRTSTSSTPSPTPTVAEIVPVCPLVDRFLTSSAEQSPRKPSLIERLSMKGRRAYSISAVTEPPSSAPTSPRPSSPLFRNPVNTSQQLTSVGVPTQTLDSPMFPPPSPHQGSPRRFLFNTFTRRPRTVSLSAAPPRTQPYGPPYYCPLPIPQPRRSSGPQRPTASTQTSVPTT